MSIFSKFLIFLIRIYQKTLGQAKGHSCKFIPTCSEYSILAIEKYGFIKGVFLGVKRVFRCHPWAKQRVDFP